MRTSYQKDRPKYLDLFRIKLPITGIVSIIHRITGVLLVLSLPIWLYLLEKSLSGYNGYQEVVALTNNFFFILLIIFAFWAILHHFLAGIRYLLFDLDFGVEKASAISIARSIFVLEAIIMVILIGWLI